ncbi:acyl-CoA thioesterase [Maribrevibacterium harenarium]|uniref:Acyl-CoA thioesterase n=1 Tax=Maribrevibacterium harenarium TaxID=2589817 RepID=A0A501X4Y7_9GAMM|nr:thioesterase family protein [Maribrevibacterium harenarium]TPE55518.1 acyl-CoA thioesterase [Maribrevibacterium harenarium]
MSIHTIKIDVRDYECDMQGIVNNAVYQNYLEHARHTFLKDKGLDFAEITKQGIHLVVMRAELDYKAPLKSGMTAVISTEPETVSRFKFAFNQRITCATTGKLMMQARIIVASISDQGKPVVFKEAAQLF